MPSFKKIAVTAVIVIVVLAIVYRVSFLRSTVVGA